MPRLILKDQQFNFTTLEAFAILSTFVLMTLIWLIGITFLYIGIINHYVHSKPLTCLIGVLVACTGLWILLFRNLIIYYKRGQIERNCLNRDRDRERLKDKVNYRLEGRAFMLRGLFCLESTFLNYLQQESCF